MWLDQTAEMVAPDDSFCSDRCRIQEKKKTLRSVGRMIEWLVSLHDDDFSSLQTTQDYTKVEASLEKLYICHSQRFFEDRTDKPYSPEGDVLDVERPKSQLCLMTPTDDLGLRILDFLEVQSLVRVSLCSRKLYSLAFHTVTRQARCRYGGYLRHRLLDNPWKQARAAEQLMGYSTQPLEPIDADLRVIPVTDRVITPSVRIPALLLPRRIIVSNCGDVEYNGVYFCTGVNGNGYVFTKPRNLEPKQTRRDGVYMDAFSDSSLMQQHNGVADEDEDDRCFQQRSMPLRCILSKRFSNENLLWYGSKEIVKEVESSLDASRLGRAKVSQKFDFWARLLSSGDATPDTCRYPSISSILGHQEDSWHTLHDPQRALPNHFPTPPRLEFLD